MTTTESISRLIEIENPSTEIKKIADKVIAGERINDAGRIASF